MTIDNLTVDGGLAVDGTTVLNGTTYVKESGGDYGTTLMRFNRTYGDVDRRGSGKIRGFDMSKAGTVYLNGKYHSDRRLKDIIGENLDAMDKINRIKVYDFTFKKDDMKTPHVGVIAQELQKIFPNAVSKDENGYLQIRHEDMFYTMINALKELDTKIKQIAEQLADNIKVVTSDSAKIKDLTLRVNQQDKEIKALTKEIAELKKAISRLPK